MSGDCAPFPVLNICIADGCDRHALNKHKKGYCSRCHSRFIRHGSPYAKRGIDYIRGPFIRIIVVKRTKPNKKIQFYQAVRINGEWKYVHRLIMEFYLGRSLLPYEQVHHIDHNGLNNRRCNLEILHIDDHTDEHLNGGVVPSDEDPF